MAGSYELAVYCLVSIFVGMVIEYVYMTVKLRRKKATNALKEQLESVQIKQESLEEMVSINSLKSVDSHEYASYGEYGVYDMSAAECARDEKRYEFHHIGIVGFGQIGNAVNTIYKNKQENKENGNASSNYEISIFDPYKNLTPDLSDCDLVNICIPFGDYESFKQTIIDLRLKKGCFIIIHSTVTMGTSNQLQNESSLNQYVFIQSPCRGVHPNLVSGFYTFEKYIGIADQYYANEEINRKIRNHFTFLNMKYFICKSNESELAKVISTTLYGLNIAVTEDIGQICDAQHLSFNNVFTNWQIGYNIGYKKLNKLNVLRPILTRIPNKEKIIGGHCVLPNCVILNKIEPKQITKNITDFILRYSDEHSRTHHTIPVSVPVINK